MADAGPSPTSRIGPPSRRALAATALVSAVVWGGGMTLLMGGPFARVVPGQGGLRVEQRERSLADLLTIAVPFGIGGALFGLGMAGVIRRASRMSADAHGLLTLAPGERLLEDGPANHLQRGIAIGGWLYLTDRRLVFLPHSMNLGLGSRLDLPLAEVRAAVPFQTLLILPSGLRLERTGGSPETLIVGLSARPTWLEAIGAAQGLSDAARD